MKIKVSAEGRENIYIPDKDSLKDWVVAQNFETIHHAFAGKRMIIGADWNVKDVLDLIDKGERVALLTKECLRNNMNHALAVVHNNELNILDIGDVEDSIEISVC